MTALRGHRSSRFSRATITGYACWGRSDATGMRLLRCERPEVPVTDREPGPARDALGRRIVTASELADLTPEERSQLHEDRALDPAALPEDVRRRLLGDDEAILDRAERVARRREAAERLRRARAS